METTNVSVPLEEVFDVRVASDPDAVAVECGDRHLTYRQLAAGSSRFAAALRRRGVSRDEVVGVSVAPSLDLLVTILGVLRAGAAWLPLDPSYPVERLRYMAADARVSRLVADREAASRVLVDGVDVIDPDAPDAADVPGPPAVLAGPRPAPEDLAYVIYTSGSTGRPKGVALTRGGLANLVRAQREAFDVGPADRVLQFAPTSFDASVFEMTMALHAGATLVLAPRHDIAPGPGLADFLRDRRITHLTLPPSVLATLPPTTLPDLRTLVCAGEALPEHLIERWQPGRRMYNAYGPTETTVWATIAEVWAGDGPPSIGTAVSGARAMVVDERSRPLAEGPGELAVGGRGVARGYLGQPGRTAERFVPDPLGDEPGARMYLTGDRVVQRSDGRLEFLGRIDQQVKIRGFRIEPDEVARHLSTHPDVTDAVVVARDSGAGAELVAYATGASLDPARLREHLARQLPAHMLPATIVPLPAMPLTPSGKVDRAALPAPLRDRGVTGVHAGPRTPTERALAAILADLLALERVGTDDDFFALGGHSLLAGRLAARVRTELGRELPLRGVYEQRTVSAMATLVDASDPTLLVPPIPTPPPGFPDGVDERAPLSFPQERVWFLDQVAPGNLAYNAQATLRLRGPLDPATLRATLTEIVRRHEVFRTAFAEIEGQPAQRPVAATEVPLPLVDLAAVPAADRERRAEDVVRDAMARPFDLAAPPLARWTLIRHAHDDHTLVHVEHHLVHDGWSFALFVAELQRVYTALAEGRAVPPPEPAARYRDFARWQREWLRGPVLDACLRHWTAELAGAPMALDLPTDRPRPPLQGFAGAAVRIDLPAELGRRLRVYSRARHTTLYATMLAGFAGLMSRYSGQRDVVVGSGVANRRLDQVEHMIGMVVNTVPLRVDLADATDATDSGCADFDTVVRRTHAAVGRSQQWQDVPLDRLVEAVAPPRDPSRNPLFQVMFSFHDSPVPDPDFAGIRGTVLERHNGSAKTDLNVVVIPRAGHGPGDDTATITLIWEYATDLFDASTAHAMVAHYLTLLEHATAAPSVPTDQLPLLTEEESRRAVAAARGPATAFPAGRTIGDLFADQVAARPDEVAVVDGDRTLTYAELDTRSSRLAHLLRRHGVVRDVPVGVLLERGIELVTVLLAVLKAGGGYVPLDPGYPAERLRSMVDDVAAPVVVTRSGPRDRFGPTGPDLVVLDELAAETAAAPPEAPPPVARPASLAYVLFTSGSTGRPKGVMVEHRAVLRLVLGTDYVAFGPDERFAQVADTSFDAFTFEMWGALLHGGTLCVIGRNDLLAPGGLGRALRDNRVTSMFLTSALFTEVMADHPDSFAGLSNLVVGGDALNASRIRRLLERPAAARPTRLVNGYGPTETTTFAVCHPITAVPAAATAVPIGRPIANTSGYVLDPHLHPVPPGVPGELYIGGPGVARGYAGRPALTAERFLPDLFGPPGARLYRTGDVVRARPDGALDFLGRADRQVKIRGFRVEPGEVEATLAAHPKIGQATVVVDDPPSGRRLVAYVVAAAGETLADDELRGFLTERLPPYLLPAAYVHLAALPMTASGKVDRAALPAPADRPTGPRDHVPAGTPTEQALSEMVADLLGIDRIGMTDDFFALGGHSLLAMRLVARANNSFTADVPLRQFLLTPTVGGLATWVDSTRGAGATEPAATGAAARLLDRAGDPAGRDLDALLRDLSDDEVDELLRTLDEGEVGQ